MTNYYTEMSVDIKLERAYHRTQALVLAQALNNPEDYLEMLPRGTWVNEVTEYAKKYDHFDPNVSVTNLGEGDTVWIHHDESITPDQVVIFITMLMKKFNLDEPVVIEWGHTASRPVLRAYGGGAAVVTKDETFWFNPHFFASAKYDELMEKANELRE